MPYYKEILDRLIDQGHESTARDVARRLLMLRNRLENQLKRKNANKSLLVATWNLREFGRNEKSGFRLDESFLYIAEIMSHFDLIAVQEVHERLDDFKRLVDLLGSWWDYIVTDVTPGKAGNQERTAFIYNGSKVRFDHLAGELVLPQDKKPVRQPSRSPFICAFRAGWRRISLCSVHIYYGKNTPNDPIRVAEISAIAKVLADRNKKRESRADGEPDNVILIGDFNIFNKTGDKTSEALAAEKFFIPNALKDRGPANLGEDKFYDQIAFHDPNKRLLVKKAGVFNFTDVIYKANEASFHKKAMLRSNSKAYKNAKDKKNFYLNWRTFQISDHFPLWMELKTDFADAYLATVMRGPKKTKTAKAKPKPKSRSSAKSRGKR